MVRSEVRRTGAAENPELEAMLAHQSALHEMGARLARIDAAISRQEAHLLAAKGAMPSSEDLERRRQQIAAAVALCEITEAERLEQEACLEREQASLGEATAAAQQALSRIEDTIAGLRKERELPESQLAQLRSESPGVSRAFLIADAERVAQDYIAAARVVTESFQELLQLQFLIARLDQEAGRKSGGIRRHGLGRFYIPAFNLQAFEGIVHPNYMDRLFDAENIQYEDGRKKAEEKLMARLRALGISLL